MIGLPERFSSALSLGNVFDGPFEAEHGAGAVPDRARILPNHDLGAVAADPHRLLPLHLPAALERRQELAAIIGGSVAFRLEIVRGQFLERRVPEHFEKRGVGHQDAPVRSSPVDSDGGVFKQVPVTGLALLESCSARWREVASRSAERMPATFPHASRMNVS